MVDTGSPVDPNPDGGSGDPNPDFGSGGPNSDGGSGANPDGDGGGNPDSDGGGGDPITPADLRKLFKPLKSIPFVHLMRYLVDKTFNLNVANIGYKMFEVRLELLSVSQQG